MSIFAFFTPTVMLSRKRTLLGILPLLLSAAAPVQAHAPPEVAHIEWLKRAADGNSAVFQTARGFVVGDTQTRSYRWACIDGLGLELGEQPSFVVLPDDSWMVATEQGLKTTSDEGCSWASVARFGADTASALVSVPGDANHLLLALAHAFDGGLYESRDTGASWQKRLDIGADDYVAQIGVAASDTSRIYLSGIVFDEEADRFSFQLTRSRDAGATWDRASIPLGPDEDRAVLAAISPTNPDSLVVLANNHRWGELPDRALYSSDAGSSFRELTSAIKLTSATFDPEGKHVMLGGGESLLRVDPSATGEQALQKIGESQLMSCAQSGPAGIYACGHVNQFDPVNAGAFVSSDAGVSWQSLMAFTEVKQAVQCTDQALAKQCKDQWIDWQLEITVGLGGAPIDSVEGWQDFKGLEEMPLPAPAHTLATAKRTMPAAANGGKGEQAGAPATISNTDQAAAESSNKMTSSGGCQALPSSRSHGHAWAVLAVFGLGIASTKRRIYTVYSWMKRSSRMSSASSK